MEIDRIISREEAVEELKRYDIEGPNIYLIDLIPLIEMIWADGIVQGGEIAVLYDYVDRHVAHINELAECELLTMEQAHYFINRFLDKRPDPELLSTLRSFIAPIRLSSSDVVSTDLLRQSLLAACIDIGSSSVAQYPYGICDRFNPDEKQCFFEILESLQNQC
jgi:hypothetical protein